MAKGKPSIKNLRRGCILYRVSGADQFVEIHVLGTPKPYAAVLKRKDRAQYLRFRADETGRWILSQMVVPTRRFSASGKEIKHYSDYAFVRDLLGNHRKYDNGNHAFHKVRAFFTRAKAERFYASFFDPDDADRNAILITQVIRKQK